MEAVVTKLTIDSSDAGRGAEAFAAAMRRSSAAADETTKSLTATERTHRKWTASLGASDPAIKAQIVLMEKMRQQHADGAKAANDNMAAARDANKSLVDTGAEVLKVAGHLKFAAVAAYALSPAFRAMVNPAVVGALAAMGPAAVSAGAAIMTAMAPAFAFMAKIAVPILVIVTAWKALSAVIDQGASLLEKYGNAQRDLIAGVDDNLKKLTKFQDAGLTAEQVQRATELGARLNEANRTIGEFSRVQFGLVDPALQLQAVWVRIVELVAAAVDKLNRVPSWAISMMAGAATGAVVGSVIPVIGTGVGAVAGAAAGLAANLASSSEAETQAVSRADALTAAHQRLGARVGSTSNFAVRFGQAVNDIANPVKELTKETVKAAEAAKGLNEYQNALQRIKDQTEVMAEQVKWLGKTTEEVDKLRIARELERAAGKAEMKIGPEARAEIDALAQRYAALKEELRRVNEQREMVESLGSSIVSAFMSGGDAVKSLTRSLASLGQQLASKQLSKFLNGDFTGGSASNLMSMGGVAGIASAGAMGYQSGSGLMGAAGGALTGFAVGGVPGALIGGAVGGIAGIFGGASQRRQQRQQQAAEAAQIARQTQLLGIDTTTRSGSMEALRIQQQGEIEAAAAERNWAKAMALSNHHRAQQLQLDKEWNTREAEVAKQKREEELRLAEEHAKAITGRIQTNTDRALLAGLDISTLEGAVLAAERAFQREREAEIEAGGEAMVSLELAHGMELQNIRDGFHKQALDKTKQAQEQQLAAMTQAARGIVNYLSGLQTGQESPLSPSARLGASRQTYDATLALARGGNADALGRITQDAETMRVAAKEFFGSGAGYQDIFKQIQSQLLNLPAVQAATDPTVVALRDVIAAVNAGTGANTNIALRQEGVYFDDIATATYVSADLQNSTNSLLSSIFGTLNGFPSYYQQMISAMGAVASSTAAAAATAQAQADAAAAAAAAARAEKQKKYDQAYLNWQFQVGPHGSYSSIPGQDNYLAPPTPAQYGLQMGGMVPGFANGGMVGNGIWDRDSVLARYAGGGHIGLAGGEYVMPANQTRMYLPQLEAMRSGAANDNGGVIAELRALRSENAMMQGQIAKFTAQLTAVVAAGFREQNTVIKDTERKETSDRRVRKRTGTDG